MKKLFIEKVRIRTDGSPRPNETSVIGICKYGIKIDLGRICRGFSMSYEVGEIGVVNLCVIMPHVDFKGRPVCAVEIDGEAVGVTALVLADGRVVQFVSGDIREVDL